MKTLIFIAPISRAEEIVNLKNDLIKYFGTRSIYTENGGDPYQGYPVLGIYDLTEADKSVITNMVGGTDVSALIVDSSEPFITKTYVSEVKV